MPITVGLYAKWGSGKSFLLSKLRGIIFAYLCIADPFSHLIHVYSRGNEGIRPSMDRAPIAVFRDSLYRDFACRNTFGRHFGCFARFMDCWSGDWCRQFFSHYDIPVHSVLGDRKVDFFFFTKLFNYFNIWFTMYRFNWNWAHHFGMALARKLESLKLVLQVTFCTPPGPQWGGDSIRIQPIR